MRRLGLLTALAVLFCGPAAAMHYDIQAGIRPEAHRLDATVVIRDPVSMRFSLHKNLTIQSVIADGKPVAFHPDNTQKPSPFAPDTVAFVVEVKSAKVLELRYGGSLESNISGVAMIKPELVEMAVPFAWYPFYSLSQTYSYKLTASLPDGMTAAANGKPVTRTSADGRTTYTWSSYAPVFDIALVAAPGMHMTAAGDPSVELFYAKLPDAAMALQRDALIKARTHLQALYGKPYGWSGLQVFFAPRRGYPYARAPLVLTSEGYVTNDLGNSEVENFRHVAHELAHYWWVLAPSVNDVDWTDNSEAWLNEGLAEYSAVLMVQDVYGKQAAQRILDQYRDEAAHGRTSDAIAETKQNSPDFFLNRYKKATLMLFTAREKFGGAKVDAFLKSFHARFKGTQGATTAAFLELAAQRMGPDAAAFFKEELYRHPVVGAVAEKK